MTRISFAVCAVAMLFPAFAVAQEPQFRLEVEGMAPILFTRCSGIGSASEVLEFKDGNSGEVIKVPGRTTFMNVVCSRPLSADNTLIEWRRSVEKAQFAKKTFKLFLLDKHGKTVRGWTFQRGWPAKWELSELDATKSEVSIETIEIAHEGLESA